MTFHAYKRLDAGKKNGTAVKEYMSEEAKKADLQKKQLDKAYKMRKVKA